MGAGFGILQGLTSAVTGIGQGQEKGQEKIAALRERALQDHLLNAQIGNYASEAAARNKPEQSEWNAPDGTRWHTVRGGDGSIHAEPIAGSVPSQKAEDPDWQLVQTDDGYQWIQKPSRKPTGTPPTPGAPTPPKPPTSGQPKVVKTGVQPKRTEQQLAAGGQADEAAKALETMMDVEGRKPESANKAAGIMAAQNYGKVGSAVADLRNSISSDPDAQTYYNANQAYRLAIAGVRGQRGAQYLLDLERRAVSRAPNEMPTVTLQRQEAMKSLIAELRKKARQSPDDGTTTTTKATTTATGDGPKYPRPR